MTPNINRRLGNVRPSPTWAIDPPREYFSFMLREKVGHLGGFADKQTNSQLHFFKRKWQKPLNLAQLGLELSLGWAQL